MSELKLTNKVSLVTGASGGIGQAIARSLSDAGSSIVISYYNNESEARRVLAVCGKDSLVVQGDVSDPTECHRIINAVIEKYGRIDILVNNAAVGLTDSFEMPYETWQNRWSTTLNTNLMSAVNLTFCSVPFMQKQGTGKIINVSSRSAFRGETEYMAYAASKAAMVNFTRCVARALAKDNIQAYAIAPGFIEAGMGLEDIAHHGEEIRAQIPSGKIGTAQDVANVVLFLASGLSDYLTGSTIDVNGGSYLH
jgi:NAD(P)-dependent dehydrogenase (short-subunit alcohol dehydrogenase family)